MTYLNPKNIITEFLRKNITDPRGRISSNSNTITATAGQTEFDITPSTDKSMSYITSVTVDGTTKTKWRDYHIDQQNKKITFFSGLAAGEEVIITFGEGSTDWIYPDKPYKSLNRSSFPRMSVRIISAPGTRLGNYEAPVEAVARIQVEIWTKQKQDGQIFAIDGVNYSGETLADYLVWQINKAFEENEEELFPVMYGYDPAGMDAELPFDEESQCHHKVAEFVLRGLEMGRVD